MPAIVPALVSLLTGDADLTALVDTRIMPLEADRSAVYPLVIYELVNMTSEGGIGGANGIISAVFRVTAIGKTYAAMDAVATAIADVLAWYQGTFNEVVFQGIFLDKTAEDRVVDPDNEATVYFMRTLDFDVRVEG